MRYKGKQQWKLSYKVFEEQDGYDLLFDIYLFPTSIQLKSFLGGIQHCVTVFARWVFDCNIHFAVPITHDNMDYCCTNDYKKGNKWLQMSVESNWFFL